MKDSPPQYEKKCTSFFLSVALFAKTKDWEIKLISINLGYIANGILSILDTHTHACTHPGGMKKVSIIAVWLPEYIFKWSKQPVQGVVCVCKQKEK